MAHESVCRPSYGLPMMISGAAKDSLPQRVSSRGAEWLMKRDRPKSVSLTSGVGREERGIDPVGVGGRRKGLMVKRISGGS